MKNCPHCNAQVADNASFCTSCGNPIPASAAPNLNKNTPPQAQPPQGQPPVYTPPYNPQQPVSQVNEFDHTAEFSQNEIHDNKIFALAVYMLSVLGIIIALLATGGKPSEYLRFHIKQSLSISIMMVLCTIVAIIPCLGWFVAPICICILEVINIICFIRTCMGKSVEAPIIRNFGFLK